jgi:hypothetical protein
VSDWLLNLPVLWMGALILGVIYLFAAGLYLLITALAVGERARAFKGISPGILPPPRHHLCPACWIPGRAGLERC